MFIYQPSTPAKVTKSVMNRPLNRGVQQAIDHVAKGWIPVNPALLKEVQEKLNDGEYKKEPQKLVEDLKKDPGLFVHAARNIKSVVEDVRAGVDPLAELATLEEEKLKRIFSVSEKQISSHRLRDMNSTQALRLQHSVISSRAAEAMAGKVEINSDVAFSAAMIRQLGHNLVAWNYPDIYTRALVLEKTKGTDLNFELKKLLGVSPIQIASKFANEWSLKPELRAVVAPAREAMQTGGSEEEEEESRIDLGKLCQMSELFAQANDPEHYPAAREKWKYVESQMPEIVSPDLFRQLEGPVGQVLSVCEEYLEKKVLAPPYFAGQTAEEGISEFSKGLRQANIYLQRCPDDIKGKFAEVYQVIRDKKVSAEGLKILVDHVIPYCGFERGCLYVEEEGSFLKPVLRMGDLPLAKYRNVRIHENHPVANTLESNVPTKREGESVDGSMAVYISGSLGPSTRPAVLYLEIDDEESEREQNSFLTTFHAIRQCLVDCLGDSILPKEDKPRKTS